MRSRPKDGRPSRLSRSGPRCSGPATTGRFGRLRPGVSTAGRRIERTLRVEPDALAGGVGDRLPVRRVNRRRECAESVPSLGPFDVHQRCRTDGLGIQSVAGGCVLIFRPLERQRPGDPDGIERDVDPRSIADPYRLVGQWRRRMAAIAPKRWREQKVANVSELDFKRVSVSCDRHPAAIKIYIPGRANLYLRFRQPRHPGLQITIGVVLERRQEIRAGFRATCA